LNRQARVPGTRFPLGTTELVSVLGLDVGMYGVLFVADRLVADREDSTLLRAKAIPNGMLGYLLGRVVNASAQIVCAVAVTLVVGAFLVTGLAIASPGNWLTLAWVLALGLLATLPLGAVLGALFPNTRATALIFLLLGGLAAVSGIFYPITHLPAFLQWLGQVFPLYWLGLGMRSALLPHTMAAAEIGHSWRHLVTFGVLSAWAIAGLVLAPVMLRRTARRESGSAVSARREKAMRRL
jgi:ABC-2 type transport system permease protein